MSEWAARRFWKTVNVAQAESGFRVLLDERQLRTPLKSDLALPTRSLAEAVAREWRAQDEKIDPLSMPVTRAANAAIDKTAPQMAEVTTHLLEYGDSDLLCYRAEGPAELVQRQASLWDPLLDWAAQDLGARLQPHQGVMHQPQNPAELKALRPPVEKMTAFELTAFHELVSLSGSLVLALATTYGFRSPEALWELSCLDESWQVEQWGEDDDAARTTAIRRAAFLDAETFFRLSSQSSV